MKNEMIVEKKPQTRPKRSEQLKPHLEKGEVGRYLSHALSSFNLPPVDTSSIEQVKERCEWYFQRCIEDDVRPTVAGISNALGVNRTTFQRWCNGSERRDTHTEYVSRIRNMLEELMEDYMQNGKINPVSGIFLMKNNFGYTDKSEVVVTPSNPMGDVVNPEDLQQKYLSDTVADYSDDDIATVVLLTTSKDGEDTI